MEEKIKKEELSTWMKEQMTPGPSPPLGSTDVRVCRVINAEPIEVIQHRPY